MTILFVLNISWNGYHAGPGQTGSKFASLSCACALDFEDVFDASRCIAFFNEVVCNLTRMRYFVVKINNTLQWR